MRLLIVVIAFYCVHVCVVEREGMYWKRDEGFCFGEDTEGRGNGLSGTGHLGTQKVFKVVDCKGGIQWMARSAGYLYISVMGRGIPGFPLLYVQLTLWYTLFWWAMISLDYNLTGIKWWPSCSMQWYNVFCSTRVFVHIYATLKNSNTVHVDREIFAEVLFSRF